MPPSKNPLFGRAPFGRALLGHALGGRALFGCPLEAGIGEIAGAKVPDRLTERVFFRAKRVFFTAKGVCPLSKREIQIGEAWEVEHITPLWLGGEQRERHVTPALGETAKDISRAAAKDRAKSSRVRRKHLGLKTNKGRPMPGTKASGIRKRMDGRVERR